MKKQQSLLTLAAAGVAIVFATGCAQSSQRTATINNDQTAAYRWVSATGWSPITDIRQMNRFPLDKNPVITYTTTFVVPIAKPADQVVASNDLPTYNDNLQPGDAFVEAAGAAPNDSGNVRRVILYTPFSTFGSPQF